MKKMQNYICEICDYNTSRKSSYEAHLLTSKHKNQCSVNDETSCKTYYCDKCDYSTSRKAHFELHLLTAKHKMSMETVNIVAKKFDCVCGKSYKDSSGLWRHKRVCKEVDNEIIEENNTITSNGTFDKDKIILQLIKENSTLQTILQEQHIETMKIMSTMNTTNNIQNNVNSNNTFNLQVFLNETCKDAMNMSEFIDSIELNLNDVELVGKNGFINGISDIVIRYLTKLDVHKRPVHCSDKKRETLYIKENNVWQEENLELEDSIMLQLIRDVRDKNADNVHKWRDMYPQCLKAYSDKTDQYNMIVHEALGGDIKLSKKEKESKIISKIAKAVYIDKQKHRIPNV